MTNLLERLRRAKDDESGAALISTVGLMMFTFMVVIALMYSSVVAVQIDSGVRSGEKSDSSIDSATSQALASATISKPSSTTAGNQCVPSVSSTAQGASYQMYRTANAAQPASVTTTGVTPGCPANGDTYVMIATTAPNATKNADGTFQKTTVTSTYKWTNPQNGFDGVVSGSTTTSAELAKIAYSTGDITVTKGNYTCGGNTEIGGDVYVPNGTLTLTGNCHITGDVYADNLVVNSSAVSVGINYGSGIQPAGNVYLTGSVTIPAGIKFDLGTTGKLYSSGTDAFTATKPPTGSPSFRGLVFSIKGNLTLPAGSRIDAQVQAGNVLATGAATINGGLEAFGKINDAATSPTPGRLTVTGSYLAASITTVAYTMTNVESSNGLEIGTNATTAAQGITNSKARFINSYGKGANTFTGITSGGISANGYFKKLDGTFTGFIQSSKNSTGGAADNLLSTVKTTGGIGLNGSLSSASIITQTYDGSGPRPVKFVGQKDLYDDQIQDIVRDTWTVPAMQTWKDYSFNPSDWTGYRIITPANCDYTSQAGIDQLNALSTPTILDLRNCTTINFTQANLNLKTSLAIVSNSFSTSASSFVSAFKGMNVRASDATKHAFYIINPDDTKDGVPTCSNATTGQLGLIDTEFSADFRTVTYTPCATTVDYASNDTWYGQIYSGTLVYNNLNLNYNRVYIPGFPSTTSAATTFNASATTRATPDLVNRVATKPANAQ